MGLEVPVFPDVRSFSDYIVGDVLDKLSKDPAEDLDTAEKVRVFSKQLFEIIHQHAELLCVPHWQSSPEYNCRVTVKGFVEGLFPVFEYNPSLNPHKAIFKEEVLDRLEEECERGKEKLFKNLESIRENIIALQQEPSTQKNSKLLEMLQIGLWVNEEMVKEIQEVSIS